MKRCLPFPSPPVRSQRQRPAPPLHPIAEHEPEFTRAVSPLEPLLADQPDPTLSVYSIGRHPPMFERCGSQRSFDPVAEGFPPVTTPAVFPIQQFNNAQPSMDRQPDTVSFSSRQANAYPSSSGTRVDSELRSIEASIAKPRQATRDTEHAGILDDMPARAPSIRTPGPSVAQSRLGTEALPLAGIENIQPAEVPLPAPSSNYTDELLEQITESRLERYFQKQLPELVHDVQEISRVENSKHLGLREGLVMPSTEMPLSKAELLSLSQHFLQKAIQAPVVVENMSVDDPERSMKIRVRFIENPNVNIERSMNSHDRFMENLNIKFETSDPGSQLGNIPQIQVQQPANGSTMRNLPVSSWLRGHPEPNEYETMPSVCKSRVLIYREERSGNIDVNVKGQQDLKQDPSTRSGNPPGTVIGGARTIVHDEISAEDAINSDNKGSCSTSTADFTDDADATGDDKEVSEDTSQQEDQDATEDSETATDDTSSESDSEGEEDEEESYGSSTELTLRTADGKWSLIIDIIRDSEVHTIGLEMARSRLLRCGCDLSQNELLEICRRLHIKVHGVEG